MNQLKNLNLPASKFDSQAEEAVLGSIINTPATLLIVARYVHSSEAFYASKNQLIYNAILSLDSEHTPVDPISVTARLRQIGKLDEAGGVAYVAQVATYAGYGKNLEHWCQIIQEHYARRQLVTACLHLLRDSSDLSFEIPTLLSRAVSDVDAISKNLTIARETTLMDTCKDLMKEAEQALSKPEELRALWGCPELERIVPLLTPSADLIILAGSPGCGKTALTIHAALTNALARIGCGFFSLEMPRKDLVRRMAVSRMKGRYTNSEVRKGYDASGEPLDLLAYQAALSEFVDSSLYICDEGGLDIQRLTLIALDWKHRHGIRLVVIDYLQLIQDATVTGNTDTARISSVSRKLKALAKLLDIPVIAISNLSKAAASSGDGRPHKEHLRESGQIEFDADAIVLLYRPQYHGIHSIEPGSVYPAVSDTRFLIQAQVEKNRNGPCSVVNIWADVATNRFFDQQPTYSYQSPF